jgi:ADP-dependent NAD(P)H-hydrate dehydratase / NAD(P)H-hydrate epimerase
MKIFRCDQVKGIDEFTIENEPVASIDLMERASKQLFKWFDERFERTGSVFIFTGPGNNGGDGLALARMLSAARYDVKVFHVDFSERKSEDWERNFKRIEKDTDVPFNFLKSADQFPVISSGDIIIDAIFGSGLTRPVEGLAAEVIKLINNTDNIKISVDIPSGLFGEDNSMNSYSAVVKADYTLSFQFPKLAFMFSENASFTGEWVVLPIGLNSSAIRNTKSPYLFIENGDIEPLIRKRNLYDHKGIFGHGLLVAGSSGKMGAAILGAGGALRSGIGLVTCHIPSCGTNIVQVSVPEAMVISDNCEDYIANICQTDSFSAVGVGPGLGTHKETQSAFYNLLLACKKPIVIDADGLNILSLNKNWLSLLPADTILTPHPKEFERLAGKTENSHARLLRQIEFSKEYNCIIILKGAHTSVSTPGGMVFFNSTGNPGMATGGSGDVLTGIILSLLSQGYTPETAAVTGVYLHGMAGDIAAGEDCYESIIASDIINCIGKAFNMIRSNGVTA